MGLKKDKIIISNTARSSIQEIFNEIKEREKSISKAHYVRNAIINKCLELKNFSGYSRELFLKEFSENYQSVVLWNYIIIFTVSHNEVKVLNVIHTSRHPFVRKNID